MSPCARQSGNSARMCAATAASPRDQLGGVADALVPLVHLDEVGLLRRRAERDVARAVVGEGLGVGLPDVHARRHQLGHGGLEVVVAHHAAGDPRRAGGHAGLVHHEHALAALREMPGGREPVDPGADDEERDGRGDGRRHARESRQICSLPLGSRRVGRVRN